MWCHWMIGHHRRVLDQVKEGKGYVGIVQSNDTKVQVSYVCHGSVGVIAAMMIPITPVEG